MIQNGDREASFRLAALVRFGTRKNEIYINCTMFVSAIFRHSD